MIDSDEDDKNNELDVESMNSTKENKNIANLVKKKMGATVIDKNLEKEIQQSAIPKGKRKVKKTREYTDDKGYFVIEDYTDYEEYEIPQKPAVESAPKSKNVMNFTQQ